MEIEKHIINQIKEKNIFFAIIYKKYSDEQYRKYGNGGKENQGIKEFQKQLKLVESAKPFSIKVQLFRLAKTNPQKEPFEEYTILGENKIAKNENINHQFEDINNFKGFGGIENYINSTIQAKSYAQHNVMLEKQIYELNTKLEKQTVLLEKLNEENFSLKQQNRELEQELKFSDMEANAEIDRISKSSSVLNNILPALGTIAANIMKVDANVLKTYLGFPDEFPKQESLESVDDSENKQFEFKKTALSVSETYKNYINKFLQDIIDQHPSPDSIITDIYHVFNYISASPENLKTLKDLIK